MKKKRPTKRKPKLKKGLPKYFAGGTQDPDDPNNINYFNRNQAGSEQPINIGDANSGIYSDGETGETYGTSKGISNNQYATMATGAALGAGQIMAGTRNANTDTEKGKAISDGLNTAGTGVASAFNPALGAAVGAVSNVGKGVRTSAEETDENGNLVNRQKAMNMHKVGSLMPHQSLPNVLSNKDAGTGRKIGAIFTLGASEMAHSGKYADKLEQDAKSQLSDTHTPLYDATGRDVNQTYAQGGMHQGSPNAEIEKQEVVQFPDGGVEQADGPSHEQGGVPVSLDPGSRIFSDKLKMPGIKKTFAKLAEKYKPGKETKVLEDPKVGGATKTSAQLIAGLKQRKLDEIFQAQESLKKDKVEAYARKMGYSLPQEQMPPQGQPMMKNGGTMKYPGGGVVLSKEENDIVDKYGFDFEFDEKKSGGYDNLDYRIAKENPNLSRESRGKIMQQIAYKGPMVDRNGSKNMLAASSDNYNPSFGVDPQDNSIYNNQYSKHRPTPNLEARKPFGYGLEDEYRNGGKYLPKYRYGLPPTVLPPIDSVDDERKPLNYRDEVGGIANGLVQNIGNIYDLGITKFGKKYDKEDSGQLTPERLDPAEAIRQANMEARTTRKAIPGLVGGNAGAALSNMSIAQGRNTMNKAAIIQSFENANVGIGNDFMKHNQGTRMLDKANEQQNKARSEDIARQAVRGIGMNSAAAFKDYKSGKMDKNTARFLGSLFENYELDMTNPNDWAIAQKIIKQKGK